MRKVILFSIAILCVLLTLPTQMAFAYTKIADDVYIQQNGSLTCTLASATMVIRARAQLCGYSAYTSITEDEVYSSAWIEGKGLRSSFTYSFYENNVSISRAATAGGIALDSLKSILNDHPEGISLYCRGGGESTGWSDAHAVFLTDYEGNTLYCKDPANDSGRIPLSDSRLGTLYGNQASILDNVTHYWYVSSYSITPTTPTAPTVYASPIGKEVDISWNDVGANSYYVYVQSKDNQSIPYGNNVGRTFSIHLGLAEGNFVAYVTAVYSSDNMKTGSAEFSTSELLPSINKGAEASYNVNEPVIISLNADVSTVDSCVLKIYRTPIGGETYLYWEGQVFSSRYTTYFPNEGHYSCCFVLTRNNHPIESEWVGWNIKENNLCAAVDKGQNGEYGLNEPVVMSVNTDVSTVDSCILKIYRTPTGGETYLYWEGQLFTSQYITSFTHEGYYSCCFILEYNNIWTESGWVGWSVKVPITSTYLVQYDANGGTDAPLSQNKIHDTALTLSSDEPKREASTGRYTVRFKTIEEDGTTIFYNPVSVPWTTSYTFKNWNTDKYGTGTSYDPGATYTANASATLYAQWNSTKTTGSVPFPDSPTRPGYVFMGWATRYGASRGNFGSYTPTRDGDVTLYATWKKMDIVLPEALNEIESEAFDGCAFSSVMLSEKTATISGRAFVDCPNLKYIYIPAATTAIAADAFAGVDGLTILGAHGSYAETYATVHGYTFIVVS